MMLLDKPKKSQNKEILSFWGAEPISLAGLAEPFDVEHVKDIAKNRLQGILLIVVEDYKNKFKIYCLNALALHYCEIDDCLIELGGNSHSVWKHRLGNIRYFDFLPCKNPVDTDLLKHEACSHFSSLLLNAGFNFVRQTRYFFEFEISEVPFH